MEKENETIMDGCLKDTKYAIVHVKHAFYTSLTTKELSREFALNFLGFIEERHSGHATLYWEADYNKFYYEVPDYAEKIELILPIISGGKYCPSWMCRENLNGSFSLNIYKNAFDTILVKESTLPRAMCVALLLLKIYNE